MPPKVMRGILKKPAAKACVKKRPRSKKEKEDDEVEEAKASKKFAEVDLRTLTQEGPVMMQDAVYYGRTYLCTWEVIRTSAAEPSTLAHEPSSRTDETFVHGKSFEPVQLNRAPWLTNLQAVNEVEEAGDDLAELREALRRHEEEARLRGKKEEKKDEKRKKKGEGEDERRPNSPKEDAEDLEARLEAGKEGEEETQKEKQGNLLLELIQFHGDVNEQ
eukprot:s148_g21.t1